MRNLAIALEIQCEHCGAAPGSPCVEPKGNEAGKPHLHRMRYAKTGATYHFGVSFWLKKLRTQQLKLVEDIARLESVEHRNDAELLQLINSKLFDKRLSLASISRMLGSHSVQQERVEK